jgi:hypothetical protein
LFALTLLAGCFPYRETYRPEVELTVIDAHGKPLAHAQVETCSPTHWSSECRFRDSFRTDENGRFHIAARRKWDWCCLGEAPLPYVIFAACDDHGGVAYKMIDEPPKHPIALRLVVIPGPPPPAPFEPKTGELVTANASRGPEARQWAMKACTR